jgi:lantibiotic biosynthesis protein
MKSITDEIESQVVLLLTKEKEIYFTSLFEGLSGSLTLLYYLNERRPSVQTKRLFENYLNRTVDAFSNTNQLSNLSNGIAGVCWTFNFLLNRKAISKDFRKDLVEIMDLVINSIELDFISGNYDLFYGFIGKIVAIESNLNYDSTTIRDKAVSVLERTSVVCENGIFWKDIDIRDHINLGLPHGMPGIVSFLCDCKSEKARRLIEKALDWLLAIEQPGLFSFPTAFNLSNSDQIVESRLAWCYGDLCVAFALYKGAKYLKNDKYSRAATRIVQKSINRDFRAVGISHVPNAGCYDVCICHGVSSIAMMYKKICEFSNSEEFHNEYKRWYNITTSEVLSFLNNFDQIKKERRVFDNIIYIKQYGFIEGIVGPIIFLLSAENKNYNEWERLFLVNT